MQASIERTRNISVALTAFSITLAIVISALIVRYISRRIARMVSLAESISKGEFKTIDDPVKDELQRLSQSLNIMSATLARNFSELKTKNQELDQFAFVVSHDLKAPLRGIDNVTRWLEEDHEDELTPVVRQNLDIIKGRTLRLENMINGLLEYARIGRVKKGAEQVDLSQLLSQLCNELVPPSFSVDIRNTLPPFRTDRLRLEQVFSNLVSNAVKYNDKEEGMIRITSEDAGGNYLFSVTDNGRGIQREYFEKIFVIFQTLQERDAFESTGVGLAIVKKILDDKKSNIHVESKVGEGTTFTFSWPKDVKPENT